MPGGVSRDNLPLHKKPGDHLRAMEFNAIAQALRPNVAVRQGFSAQGELNGRDMPRSRNKEQWVQAHVEIPAYSIFTLQGNVVYPASDPVRFQSAKFGIDNGGSPLIFFTNDQFQIDACQWGNCRPINDYDTALVRWGSDFPPTVGMWCGPKLDDFTMDGTRFGFVVLGVEGDGELVRVMRSAEPHAVVGTVTERITAFDPCSRALGKGKIAIEYRNNDSDELEAAADPRTCVTAECDEGGECGSAGSGTFEVDVYNASETEYPASNCYRLMAVNTLGLGLLVLTTLGEPPTGSCCSSSSSSGSTSGSESSSSSGSGECVDAINGTPLANIPGWEVGRWQALVHAPNEHCLQWKNLGPCEDESSSS